MLIAAEEGAGNSWIMLAVLGGLFVLMLVMTILPNKKRKKQAQEMMSTIKAGVKVKTIGGFVGTVFSVDDAANMIVLNMGTDENPIMVNLDKSAIYTVLTPQTVAEPINPDATTPEPEVVVSEEDAVEDAKLAEKKAEKQAKKEQKAREKAEKEALKEAEKAEDVKAEEVVEAEVVEAEVAEDKE